MSHAIAEVVPEVFSSGLAAVESAMNQGNFAFMFKAKLYPTDDVLLP